LGINIKKKREATRRGSEDIADRHPGETGIFGAGGKHCVHRRRRGEAPGTHRVDAPRRGTEERKRERGRGRRRGGEEDEGKMKGKGRIRVEPQIPVIGMQHTKKGDIKTKITIEARRTIDK
jgi:hypothetical protein